MKVAEKTKIDIREEKNIKSTKLLIRGIDINVDSYEAKLLSEDNIDNIIKFQILYENDEKVLSFDVSNTISMDEYIKSTKLKKKDICDIMTSVDDILTSLENYLVSENSIALDMNLIRVFRIYKY